MSTPLVRLEITRCANGWIITPARDPSRQYEFQSWDTVHVVKGFKADDLARKIQELTEVKP